MGKNASSVGGVRGGEMGVGEVGACAGQMEQIGISPHGLQRHAGKEPAKGLVLLVGIPAAGKTTLAKRIGHILTHSRRITFDEWPGDWPMGKLRAKHDEIYQVVRDTLTSLPPQIVVLDDTMHLQSMRKRYWRLCQHLRVGICFIQVTCPLETAIRRDLQREASTRIGAETIQRIFYHLEAVTAEQQAFLITTNGVDIDVELIMRMVALSRLSFVEAFSKCTRETSLESINEASRGRTMHEGNILLNRLVGEFISGIPRHPRRDFGLQLERARRVKSELFQQLKRNPTHEAMLNLTLAFMDKIRGSNWQGPRPPATD